ncbi:MAG: sigma-E factor regulatory protein RseB domain-containing protein [Planctomycetota bacterium]
MTRPLLALLALTLTGCTGLRAHAVAHHLATGLYAIEHYDATFSERGILRADPTVEVRKRVRYAKLWRVRAEVVEPEEHRGELFVFDGSTLTVWWPRFFFGLRVKHLEVPPRNEVGDAILWNTHWLLERYDLEEHEAAAVAGRPVSEWSVTPDEPAPLLYPYQASMDAHFHVPLRLDMQDTDGRPFYSFRAEAIDFEAEVPDDAFAVELPEGAIVHEWDLAEEGVSLEEAERQTEFPLLVPQHLPPGHSLQKVLISELDGATGAALILSHRGHWLSLTEIPNMGPILVPELGIPVAFGLHDATLNVVFGFYVLSWAEGTTHLTLISNLPYPELVEVAASCAPLAKGN